MARPDNRPFKVEMRAEFAAYLTATIGIDFWNRELAPLFEGLVSRRWYLLDGVPGTDYKWLRIKTGHIVIFRVDYESNVVIPRRIIPPQ